MRALRVLEGASVVAVFVLLGACAQSNPISKAETLEQGVYAAYGTFVIAQERAADMVQDSDITDEATQVIVDANRAARPVINSMMDSYSEYASVRKMFEAQEITVDRVVFVMDNLEEWVKRASKLAMEFLTAVSSKE
jgi:hypothetical protein